VVLALRGGMYDETSDRAELYELLADDNDGVSADLMSTAAAVNSAADGHIEDITGLWSDALQTMQQQLSPEMTKVALPQFLAASTGGRIRVVVGNDNDNGDGNGDGDGDGDSAQRGTKRRHN
jgi:hypothetical protein